MLVGLRAAIAFALLAGSISATATPTQRTRVWIDTDPAIGEPERDVDDGFALLQAMRSPELEIRGVSIVFGNAPFDKGLPIARGFVREWGPRGLRVFGGASSVEGRGQETDATRALAEALREVPLTILALGPATNVATLVMRRPELVKRIVRVIAVAGRRPGQRFTTGTLNVKGHRDFNFELDPEAFKILIEAKVPLVLAPFEISSQVWIEAADIDRLARGPRSAQALATPSRAWLDLWRRLFGVNGFNPFDTLAVGYVVAPAGFGCEALPIEIQTLPDDITEPGMQGTEVLKKPYLLVSESFTSPGRALYCSKPPASFKPDLFERLLR
jgi:pyrimidine-specific ribonucleoside hydrolase